MSDIWDERAKAVAQVADYATGAMYGEQEETLREQIERQWVLIKATSEEIKELRREIHELGERVERGATQGTESLRRQVTDMRQAIRNLPRTTHEARRRGRD